MWCHVTRVIWNVHRLVHQLQKNTYNTEDHMAEIGQPMANNGCMSKAETSKSYHVLDWLNTTTGLEVYGTIWMLNLDCAVIMLLLDCIMWVSIMCTITNDTIYVSCFFYVIYKACYYTSIYLSVYALQPVWLQIPVTGQYQDWVRIASLSGTFAMNM